MGLRHNQKKKMGWMQILARLELCTTELLLGQHPLQEEAVVEEEATGALGEQMVPCQTLAPGLLQVEQALEEMEQLAPWTFSTLHLEVQHSCKELQEAGVGVSRLLTKFQGALEEEGLLGMEEEVGEATAEGKVPQPQPETAEAEEDLMMAQMQLEVSMPLPMFHGILLFLVFLPRAMKAVDIIEKRVDF